MSAIFWCNAFTNANDATGDWDTAVTQHDIVHFLMSLSPGTQAENSKFLLTFQITIITNSQAFELTRADACFS